MGTSQRDWLDVPFSDNDAAKGLDARWDPTAKRWDPTPSRDDRAGSVGRVAGGP